MRRTTGLVIAAMCIMSVGLNSQARAQVLQSSAFTYQGRVAQSGAPLNANATIQLSLWKDAFSNNVADRIGSVQTLNNVPVTNGVFTVVANSLLEFGINPFNGEARWLQVAIDGQSISPRQQISSVPYASGLTGGGGATNNSSGTTTFAFTNLSTNTTANGANTLAIRRGNASGISLSSYFPGALWVDTANVNAIIATTSSPSAYAIFGLSSGVNGAGVSGRATGGNGIGLLGEATEAGGTAVYGGAPGGGYAGRFAGKGLFTGNLGIGGALPDVPLNINVGSNNLVQFRFDSSLVPGMNINNTGGLAGIMRLRNALEIWPSDNAARAGKLDVRDAAGSPTVTLDGATGNVSANNLPGIAYTQTFRDPRSGNWVLVNTGFVTVDTLSVNVPAAGALLVTATVNVNLVSVPPALSNKGWFKLEDTSSGNAVLLTEVMVKSQGDINPGMVGNAQVVTISWVVPVAGPGVKSFKTTLTNPGPDSITFWTSSLNALYVPKTY